MAGYRPSRSGWQRDDVLIVSSSDGEIGRIELVDGRLVADPPQLAALADRFLLRGGTEAEAYAALDGWSNGYVTVRRQG